MYDTIPAAPPKGASANLGLRRRITAMSAALVTVNLALWALALVSFGDDPVLLGTALLAYSFGLRHAVDADHIAAIDNLTRKFMQQGRRPVSVGLWFSLGHSSVVLILSAVVAGTASVLQAPEFAELRSVGGVISTLVSAGFLMAIAAVNLMLMRGTWQSLRALNRGAAPREGDPALGFSGGGILTRAFSRLFRMVDRNWQIYLLGFLFGFGFDTATEIGVLGISATGGAHGLHPWEIMLFPLLFSAAMALVDTADGMLMLGAYQWAYVEPRRKLVYNLVITGLSVAVALLIGLVETLGLIGDKLSLSGGFWQAMSAATDSFGTIGYGIVALFLLGWLGSWLYVRLGAHKREIRARAGQPGSGPRP
ncbi:nickel transporter [Defluviimonas sp. 20V17]|uniref:Nickel/cobalt efflux system n=1 Tax=Allgaiera indica TaxID=765699 RepID=A0AAN4URC8_9RHOB|nr:HoxN/HupN/NixA family nickel/cobalt transporter [Allgaiera indica]KDB02429.1 nickel transporter [Defluviimonas sp. 20V17]GHE02097.1 nickel/cobalt efflux system [Allgaiera indica]SDX04806.1 high-affinity nickel-transport protein [Allgaiera indica]